MRGWDPVSVEHVLHEATDVSEKETEPEAQGWPPRAQCDLVLGDETS